jgi:RNA polymerase sigma factor (sigma-70 family)
LPDRFRDLYRGEFAFVWSTARYFGVPASMLDDVAQEVFLTAYRRLDQVRFEVSPRAWLFGVTRRVAHRHRRAIARQLRKHAALAAVAAPAAPVPQDRHDDAQQLEQLLGRLRAGTRAVWEMTELLGMNAPEIASELCLPLNTVYSRLRLARQQLDAIVGDPQRLSALHEVGRRRRAPPRGAEPRTWSALVVVLDTRGPASAGLAWIKAHAAVATTMVSVGAAALVLASGSPDGVRAGTFAAEPPIAAHGRGSAPAVRSPPSARPATPVQAPATSAADGARASARKDAGAGAARLAEEVALLDRARAQLGARDLTAALATLGEHTRRFPAGTLADARAAAQIDALCRLGDAAAAVAMAQGLVAAHPGSAVAQRFIGYSCDGVAAPRPTRQ